MNIEAYRFTLLVALLGMSIVFAFLALLSILMVVITRLSDAAAPRSGASVDSADVSVAANCAQVSVDSADLPLGVLLTAVAAYCVDERQDYPSAAAWGPRHSRRWDGVQQEQDAPS